MNPKLLPIALLSLALPMAVVASPDTDRKIEDAAKASYNYRTVLEDHVAIKVSEGVVTLTGVVPDNEARALAASTVENLPGVLAVKNEITVDAKYPEHSDSWMAFKIRSRLLVKANVSAADTKVTVRDGVVTLTGTADSLAQKELTAAYAKEIDGVRSVDNQIEVTSHPSAAMTVGEKIDDASITSQVKYALLAHKSTSALKTKVTTTDGVVVISGDAANDAEKSLVSKLAADVRGVKSVRNNMTVRS